MAETIMPSFSEQNSLATVSADLGSKSSASSITGNDAFSKINTLNSKFELNGVYYGTSSTAAGTQEKVVTASDFPSSLKAGQKLCVKFTKGQTYNGQPTLNVNSLGAKSICKFGSTAAARYEWQAGQVIDFMYDGTNWIIVDGQLANGNYPGKVKLSDAYTSSGGAAADGVGASSKAVYDAYTALNGSMTASRGTATAVSTYYKNGSIRYFTIGNVCFVQIQDLEFKTAIAGSTLITFATGLPVPKYSEYFALLSLTNGGTSTTYTTQIRVKITSENSTGVIKEHYSLGGFQLNHTYEGFFAYIVA